MKLPETRAVHRQPRGPCELCASVDVALHRLSRRGTIRRLVRGVYDFPKEHPALGPLAPSAEAVARALSGRDRTRLQPAGAHAANVLGLSEQVPAKARDAGVALPAAEQAELDHLVQEEVAAAGRRAAALSDE